MKLNLGCGYNYKKQYLNLDNDITVDPDIVHDLNKIPLPFENETFDYILAEDILEHINLIPLMNELHRILRNKGLLRIRVPHFTSAVNYEDPTHINQFSVKTFDYFIKEKGFSYNRNVKYFSKIIKKIVFSEKKNFFSKMINRFLEKFVNKSETRQIMYESTILQFIPAFYIELLIIK